MEKEEKKPTPQRNDYLTITRQPYPNIMDKWCWIP